MARRCDLTDKGAQSGNNVSHAQNKNRRRFKVNLQNVTVASKALNRTISLKIAVSTLRSIDHNGGLDNFLLKTSDSKLSTQGMKLKKKIKKVLSEEDNSDAESKTKKAA